MRAAQQGDDILEFLRSRRAVGRTRRRRLRIAALVALAVANLAVLGTDLYLLTQRNVTRTVTFTSALQRFRQAGPGEARATAGAVSDPLGSLGEAIPSGVVTSAGGQAVTPVAVRSGPTAAAVSSGGPVVPPRSAAPFAAPPEGVYAYRTTGGERIDILNAAHSYPSVTYGTVLHQGGCTWQLENDVIKEHTDRRRFCSASGQLFQLDQARYITFFGRTDGLDYTCKPRLELATGGDTGASRDGVCSDSSGDAAAIHETDLGTSQVVVGNVTVAVVHVVLDSTLSGRAVGRAHDDLLVLAGTGLTVSWHRTVDTVADAAFGAKAHYTERATFDLISLDPRT